MKQTKNPKKSFYGILFGVMLIALIIISCAKSSESSKVKDVETTIGGIKSGVPDFIIKEADKLILSKVGNEFFQYIKFERGFILEQLVIGCTKDNPACTTYQLTYHLKIPDKPFVDYSFALYMDNHKHLIYYGALPFCIDNHEKCIFEPIALSIPDCVNSPKECTFPIDEIQAKEIAEKAGFEKGSRDWRTSFSFYPIDIKTFAFYLGNNGTFAWIIRNTLSADSIGDANGKEIIIDANSGDVLGTREWRAVHAPLSPN